MTLFIYFMRRLGYATGFLWLIISVLFFVFSTFRASADHNLLESILLSLLKTPQLSMDILPFACALGAANTLRQMDEARELMVMRASGLSLIQTALLTGLCALPFVLAHVAIGELLLEPSRNISQVLKNQTELGRNIWIKLADDYVQIGELSPDGALSDIVIYQTAGDKINAVITANRAEKTNEHWRLIDGNILHWEDDGLRWENFSARLWPVSLPTSSLAALKHKSRDMPIRRLAAVSAEISRSGQSNSRFLVELWKRLLAMPALILLTAAGVWAIGQSSHRRPRSAAIIALAISGGYYLANIISVQAAIAYKVPPLMLLPFIFIGVCVYLGIRRKY